MKTIKRTSLKMKNTIFEMKNILNQQQISLSRRSSQQFGRQGNRKIQSEQQEEKQFL